MRCSRFRGFVPAPSVHGYRFFGARDDTAVHLGSGNRTQEIRTFGSLPLCLPHLLVFFALVADDGLDELQVRVAEVVQPERVGHLGSVTEPVSSLSPTRKEKKKSCTFVSCEVRGSLGHHVFCNFQTYHNFASRPRTAQTGIDCKRREDARLAKPKNEKRETDHLRRTFVADAVIQTQEIKTITASASHLYSFRHRLHSDTATLSRDKIHRSLGAAESSD